MIRLIKKLLLLFGFELGRRSEGQPADDGQKSEAKKPDGEQLNIISTQIEKKPPAPSVSTNEADAVRRNIDALYPLHGKRETAVTEDFTTRAPKCREVVDRAKASRPREEGSTDSESPRSDVRPVANDALTGRSKEPAEARQAQSESPSDANADPGGIAQDLPNATIAKQTGSPSGNVTLVDNEHVIDESAKSDQENHDEPKVFMEGPSSKAVDSLRVEDKDIEGAEDSTLFQVAAESGCNAPEENGLSSLAQNQESEILPLEVLPETIQQELATETKTVGQPNDRCESGRLYEQSSISHDVPGQNTTPKPIDSSDVAPPSPVSSPLARSKEAARPYSRPLADISSVESNYAKWNSAIVEQLLLTRANNEDVYLSITPRILANAYAGAGFDVLSGEEAEASFVNAVAKVYHDRVLQNQDRLRVLRRCGRDGSPDCVAFLAATVLAAYRMQFDEDAAGHAYYIRLAEILKCQRSANLPVGFKPEVFESLWLFLGNWLIDEHELRLAMPGRSVAARRYVAIPLAHVPLRCLDIEKLPSFFGWARYERGDHLLQETILRDLRNWQSRRNVLTQPAAKALKDDRSAAVAAQVASEFESWDGSFAETSSRRAAPVELRFDIIQRLPELSFLPRRPQGFPAVFDDGAHLFAASQDGWYDPAPVLPDDGALLADGFDWSSTAAGIQYSLRRTNASVVSLTPSSDYSGFLSNPHLLRGVKCVVMCRDDSIAEVKEYLGDVTQSRCEPRHHPKLPNNWRIFCDVIARNAVAAPENLHGVEVDPKIDLLLSGGLRLGRRSAWISGAAPRIIATGIESGDQVTVNGNAVDVSPEGELLFVDGMRNAGVYVIQAGRSRRRIEIVEPDISNKGSDGIVTDRSTTVALPAGNWTLIGEEPKSTTRARSGAARGSVVHCKFLAIWAIEFGAGPGARVALLNAACPSPTILCARRSSSQRRARTWAGVIYGASIRRPNFLRMDGAEFSKSDRALWDQYVVSAKQLKRSMKKH